MGNIKQYLSYFLCITYTITVFLMYSILLFNDSLSNDSTEVLQYVFPVTMIAIALFSVFFITYAHTSFLKSRTKEFGIYTTLGMDQKELKNLVTIENCFICGGAILTAMLIGTLFSRLFQMVILSLMEIEGIEFHLSIKAYLLTLGVFLAIFGIVFILSSRKMSRIDVSTLLQEARKTESHAYGKKDMILGILGVIILIMSAISIRLITTNEKISSSPLSLVLFAVPTMIGFFFVINYGGNMCIYLVKKTNYYIRHMLGISEIHYKFSANNKIVFTLSILSAMTIMFLASPFSLLRLSAQIADDGSHHLEYASIHGVNEFSEDEIQAMLTKSEATVTNQLEIPFVYLYQSKDSMDLENTRVIFPVSKYNELTGNALEVQPGDAINIHADWIPGTRGVEPETIQTLYAGALSYDFHITSSGRNKWIVELKTFPNPTVFILNDQEYDEIVNEIAQNGLKEVQTGTFHFFDFKNWKTEEKVIEMFDEATADSVLQAQSVLDVYKDLKKGYSVFLFVSSVLGILFFFAGGGVLYFKQFSELPAAKRTFYKLYKIGMTQKEMKRMVASELRVIFFLPLVFGTFLGMGLIYIMTFFVGGDYVIDEFIRNTIFVVIVYFISQNIFYFLSKKRYDLTVS